MNNTNTHTMTHTESFKRFNAQPIGRAKLFLIDYAQTNTDGRGRRQLYAYTKVASELSIRTFAAMVESTQPNASDFGYLIGVKYNLANSVK